MTKKHMHACPIDGKTVAAKIMNRVARMRAKLKRPPGLAAILVGDDPASHLYVRLKEKACRKARVHFEQIIFPGGAAETDVLATVDELNRRTDIDAILVQLPLPEHLDEDKVIAALDPAKDVDGFHAANIAALLQGQPRLLPGLAAGIMELIDSTGIEPDGLTATIVANSRTFYEPLACVLVDAGFRTIFLGPDDRRLAEATSVADVLIVAVGRQKLITGDMVKPGAVVIDVGTNRLGKRVVGDVDDASVGAVAGYLTPVPGGVGPVTVAMLMANTVTLSAARQGKK